MAVQERSLSALYFHNALIEFLYFIIIYIENYSFIFVSTLAQHVKFFKSEVGELLSSFSGLTLEENIHHFITFMECFELEENKVKSNQTVGYLKNSIFEDFVISKTVDLVLRGCTNINDICKILNFSTIISIDCQNLIELFKRSTHFSIQNNCQLSLNHFHGILGYETSFCNHVTNSFYNFLQNGKLVSFVEIKSHAKCITSCRDHDILSVLSILYCSESFHFENGSVGLNKKLMKAYNTNSVHINILNEHILETSMPTAEMVFSVYGTHIENWTGEIFHLSVNCGSIHCAFNLAKSHHDVLVVHFNQTSLKVICEIPNLKECLKVGDVVKFNAKYFHSEKMNYWKAERIVVQNNMLDHNEQLLNTLEKSSEVQRKICTENEFSNRFVFGSNFRKCFHISQIKDLESVIVILDEGSKFKQNETIVNNDSEVLKNPIINNIKETGSSNNTESVLNFFPLSYLFVFGRVVMMIANKGVATTKHGSKIFYILFQRNSIYPKNKSADKFHKDQAIFAAIPYIEDLDTVCVAPFVYGLSDADINMHSNPEEFAKYFFQNISLNPFCRMNAHYSKIDSGSTNLTSYYASYPHIQGQLNKLHKLILTYYSKSVHKALPLALISSLNMELARNLKKKCGIKDKFLEKYLKVVKTLLITSCTKNCTKKNSQFFKNSSSNFTVTRESSPLNFTVTRESSPLNTLTVSKSLNQSCGSFSSLISYKSLGSDKSSEVFHSCESFESKLKKSNSSSSCSKLEEMKSNSVSSQNQKISLSESKSNITFVLEDMEDDLYSMASKNNPGIKSKKKIRAKCFYLQSFLVLKHLHKKINKLYSNTNSTKSNSINYGSSFKVAASVSLVTNSFLFYDVNINDCCFLLPLPRKIIPPRLLEKMKLNSCSELVILPHTRINFPHVLSAKYISEK